MLRSPSFLLRRSGITMTSASFEQEPLFEVLNRVCGLEFVRCFSSKGGRQKSKASLCPSIDPEKVPKRLLALEAALSQISNTFGGGTVMWLGRENGSTQVPVISTGSLALDAALGIGGLPRGRIVEIFGPEASGKTTLALHVIAEAQKNGGRCFFIDAENALDRSFAEALGVRTNDLLISQPDSGEQALNLVDQFVRSGTADVIVVDSVSALVRQAKVEGEMEAAHMALQARLMSQSLRKLMHIMSKSNALIIFINETRSKLGSVGFGGGYTKVPSGGNALKFYASVRLNICRVGQLKVGGKVVGSSILVKVVKNKLAPPFKLAEFEIEFGKGISSEGEIIDQALKFGLIQNLGGWHCYNDKQMGNGRENAKRYLREHNVLYQNLLSQIKGKLLGEYKNNEEKNGLEGEHAEKE